MKQKDTEDYFKKWNRRWNILVALIAISMGSSIFLVWILLVIFLPGR